MAAVGGSPVRVVSIHDVSSVTLDLSRRLLGLCEESGVRASLLVVPGPWRGARVTEDLAFRRWLEGAAGRGHEVSLHGWTHEGGGGRSLADRFIARRCGEFAALDRSEALRRLERGLAVMEELGHRVEGFTAPGWLLSSDARAALVDLGFAYTTTHLSVLDLSGADPIPAPAFCQRPDSPLTGIGSRLVRRVLVARVAGGRAVRLALHPRDLSTEALTEATRTLVQVMGSGPTTTYAECIRAGIVAAA